MDRRLMRILVIGISVRAMVESAVRSNYSVIAMDAFGDQDLNATVEAYSLRRDFRVPYRADALYELSRRFEFDAVAYTSNLENHPEVLDRFASRCPLLGNFPDTVRNVRDWPGLFSRLQAAGFGVPETIFAGQERKFSPERRWLLKPVFSGGGHGISFFEQGRSAGEGFFLQQYLPGKPCSASFLANGHESVLIGITEQIAGVSQFGAGGFRYCGNMLPLPEAVNSGGETILEQVRGIAAFLTREYGLAGANGFDFILQDDCVWITEVNPRYSASMELIERAYGLPIFDLHLQAAVNGIIPEFKLESELSGGSYFAKGILYCERESFAPEIRDWQERDLRDVPHSGEILHKGGPICTVFANRANYRETYAELIRRAEAIKKEIYG